MLAWLTNGWRKRAAALLVALYALCVVAPVAAMAASDGAMPTHCLDHDHDGMASPHGDGSDHRHSIPSGDDHGNLAKCCGLFGVNALAPTFDVVVGHIARVSDVAMPPPAESLLGRNSDRIDRPPRFLRSI
ncbi:MAG TPA: hypothetical protein VG986_03995 [Pseudolabrys sp.]|nr:hypothetical protein [Pseudolabrys sp.]